MTGWRKNFVFTITGTYLYIEWAEKDFQTQETIVVL